MRVRLPALKAAVSAVSLIVLAACGGGGGSSGSTVTPIDIAGIWTGDETATGGAAGLMLSVGDVAYGLEVVGTTVRYFKGSAYSSDGENFTFGSSRYDESTSGSSTATASVSGKLIGKFIAGTTPRELFVTYEVSGGTSNNFFPMRMDPAAASIAAVADLRDFAGTFALPAGSLTLAAGSSTTATLSGSGVNGCNVSGTLSLPRADRNVWATTLNQSGCTDTTRNGKASTGLAMLYKSGTTLNIAILAEDGRAWTLVSSSR